MKIKEYVEHLAKSVDGMEAVKPGREMQLDVAKIDISTSYLSGIETTKQIKAGSPDTTALIASHIYLLFPSWSKWG